MYIVYIYHRAALFLPEGERVGAAVVGLAVGDAVGRTVGAMLGDFHAHDTRRHESAAQRLVWHAAACTHPGRLRRQLSGKAGGRHAGGLRITRRVTDVLGVTRCTT